MFANLKEKVNNVVSSKGYLKASVLNAAASTSLVVSSFAASPVSAAEGDMSAVTGGVTTLTTVMGDMWSFMIANPLMTTYMAVGLVSACFGLIKRGKRASR